MHLSAKTAFEMIKYILQVELGYSYYVTALGIMKWNKMNEKNLVTLKSST